LQDFIKIDQKEKTEIRLAGREIPIDIENKVDSALKIFCYKHNVGIQGKIKLNTADDGVDASPSVTGDLEFSAGGITTSGNHRLRLNSRIAISVPDGFFEKIASGSRNLRRNVAAETSQQSTKTLELASNSVLSVKTDMTSVDSIKNGFINVTESFKMPRDGNVKLVVDSTDITSDVDFRNVKKFVQEPLKVFCSKTDFNCSRWTVSVEGDKKMPQLQASCKNESNMKCLYVQLSQLPDWLPERYCLSTSAKCPDGYAKFEPSETDTIVKGVHNSAKEIIFNVTEAMGDGVSFNISDFATEGASLSFETIKHEYRTLNLNVGTKANQKAASLKVKGLKLNFSASSPDDELIIDIPEVKWSDVDFSDEAKHLRYRFRNNSVDIDLGTYTKLNSKKFENLTLSINGVVDRIEAKTNEYQVKASNQVKATVQKADVSGIFTADVKINENLTVGVELEDNVADGVSLKVDSKSTKPNIKFDSTWNAATSIKKGIIIDSDIPTTITDLPENAKIILAGKGSATIYSKGNSVDVAGETEVKNERTFRVEAGKTFRLNNISFRAKGNTASKLIVKDINEDDIVAYANELNVEASAIAEADSVRVNGKINLNQGAQLTIKKLSFSNALPRRVLEDSTNELILRYKFEDDGFPQITIDEPQGTPSKIRVIYSATAEEVAATEFNEWIGDPHTIVLADFDMATCEQWESLVSFETESTINPSMKVVCDTDSDYSPDESNYKIALQIYLNETPADESSSLDDSTASTSTTTTIVIAIIAAFVVVGIIAFCVYWFKCRATPEDNKDEKVVAP